MYSMSVPKFSVQMSSIFAGPEKPKSISLNLVSELDVGPWKAAPTNGIGVQNPKSATANKFAIKNTFSACFQIWDHIYKDTQAAQNLKSYVENWSLDKLR